MALLNDGTDEEVFETRVAFVATVMTSLYADDPWRLFLLLLE